MTPNSFSSLIRRLVAGVTALALTLPNTTFAMPIASIESAATQRPVTLILDAHASLEAQKAIVRQLETLQAQGALQGLLIEGAAGPLDAQKLLSFKSSESNQTYGNELLSRGLIGAGLRFLMNHPDVPAYGLEDPKLYAQNRRQYQKVMRSKAILKPVLEELQENLETEAEHSFSAQAAAMLKISRIAGTPNAGNFEALREVMRQAMTWTDLDWNDWKQQADWPNLMRLWRLWQEESTSDGTPQKLRDDLGGKSAREKLESLYAAEAASEASQPKTEAELKKARDAGKMTRLLALQTLREEIETPLLFQEVQRLESFLAEHSRLSEKEQRLLTDLKQIALIRKALALELARQEAAALPGLLLGSELESFQKDLSAAQFTHLLNGLSEVTAFYEWARFRETTLSEHIVNRLRASGGQGTWGVVMGGFHEEGLVLSLQQNGFQAKVVMPEFDGQNDPLLYQRLMHSAEKGTLALPQIAAMQNSRQAAAMVGARSFRKWEAALAYVRAGVKGEKKATTLQGAAVMAKSEVRSEQKPLLQRRIFLAALAAGLAAAGNVLAQEGVLAPVLTFPDRAPEVKPRVNAPVSEPVLLIRPGDMEERLSLADEKTRLAMTEVTQRMYEAATLSGTQYEAVIDYRNTDDQGRPMLRLTISPRGSYGRSAVGSLIGWNPGQLFEKIYDDAMLMASGRQGIQQSMAQGLVRVEFLHFRKKLDDRIEAGRKALVHLQAAYEEHDVTVEALARAQELVTRIKAKQGILADALDVDNVDRTAQLLKRQVNKRRGAINTASTDVLAVVSLRQTETGAKVKPEALDLDYWPPEWRGLKIQGLTHEELEAQLARWKVWAREDGFRRLFSEDPQTRRFTGAHHGYQAALEARYVSFLSAKDIEARRMAKSDFGILPGLVNGLFGRTGPYAPRNAEVNGALTNVQRMDAIKEGIKKEEDTNIKRILEEIATELLALNLLNQDIAERDKLIAEYEQALNDTDPTRLQALVRDKPEEDLAVQLNRLTEDRQERIQSRARIAALIFELKSMRALAIDPQYSRPRGEAAAPTQNQPGRSIFQPQPQTEPQPFAPQTQPARQGPSYPQPGMQGNQPARFPAPAPDGGPAWLPDGRGGWYRDLPAKPLSPSNRPASPRTYPPVRSEVRKQQVFTDRDILAVDTAAAAAYGLLLPQRAAELLLLLKQRQALGSALLRRAAQDVPGGVPQNLRELFPRPAAPAPEDEADDNVPVMFIRAALFEQAPLRYFPRMVLEGLPLIVVFEPGEEERYHAVEQKIQKISAAKNPGRTFFILAQDGSASFIARVLSKTDETPRYQVAASQSEAFSARMKTLRDPADAKNKREAAFIGIEPREARRISAAQIPFRFFYSGRGISAAEWDYRFQMLGFVLHHAGLWKQWAGESPQDLRLVLGHILEQLSLQNAQAALLEASA